MTDAEAVVQYLDWAVIAAYRQTCPDCVSVTLQVDLKRRSMTTSYQKEGDERKPMLVSLRQATILRQLFDARIKHLEGCIEKATGSLYPGIWGNEINELEALFEQLTGFPLCEDKE